MRYNQWKYFYFDPEVFQYFVFSIIKCLGSKYDGILKCSQDENKSGFIVNFV